MSEAIQEKPSKTLRDYGKEKPAKTGWFREKCGFLFRIDSLFYFGLLCAVTALLWTVYSVVTNSFTQMFNWDYAWQYVPFAYDYYDAWHVFFVKGQFPLYDARVWMGTDAIGSGSYYGLFDPFVFFINFFPRSWIPQTYFLSTVLRITVSCFLMRSYLKYMGIKEWTARIGAIAYSLSGYATFMAGFASFISATSLLPLMLLGIEKVLKEQKPIALSAGVALIGLSNFFLLVPCCIFGVIYALWRYGFTFKTRNKGQNGLTIVLGIAGFGLGLCLSAFSLFPSLRETLLSGRSASVGSAYLTAIKNSLKEHNLLQFFSLIFEEVGDNPGRELMGVISFFFPTGGFTILPMARSSGYDAWTASLFVYTPMLISFFAALIHSVRLKKWHHFLAVAFCVLLVFTNFSYFFFYAFSGNGYGRWFIVLVPVIVYYACWGFDQRTSGPKWIPVSAGLIALVTTIGAYYLIDYLLKGKNFPANVYNTNGTTYWQTSYHVASEFFNNISAAWYFYYQLALIAIETVLIGIGTKKKWLPKALLGCVAFEAVIMGNATYAFNGTYSVEHWWAGGRENVSLTRRLAENILSSDQGFYRTQSDTFLGTNYAAHLAGLNNTASFHSLMNFETETFSLAGQMKRRGGKFKTYADEYVYNPSWSGFYANKRLWMDETLGYRYYINQSTISVKDKEGKAVTFPANYPFGASEVPELEKNGNGCRVYRRDDAYYSELGFLADPSKTYRLGVQKDSDYANSFYHGYGGTSSFIELQGFEQAISSGAIVEDDVELKGIQPKAYSIPTEWAKAEKELDGSMYCSSSVSSLSAKHVIMDYYETERFGNQSVYPSPDKEYQNEGFAFFLNNNVKKVSDFRWNQEVNLGKGKVVMRPSGSLYFDEDPKGTYFEIRLPATTDSTENKYHAPAFYAIGDRFDEEGNIVEENACLGFDYTTADAARRSGIFDSSSSTFGLYARDGKVKYVVLAFEEYLPSAKFSLAASNIYFHSFSRTYVESKLAALANNFKNVVTGTNTFDFDIKTDVDKIAVTQLGFDKGWSAVAMIGGKKVPLQSLKVDGGLYGFVAPAQPEEYHMAMRYQTPYSTISAVLWIFAVTMGGAYLTSRFIIDVKKEKRKLIASALNR